MTYFTTELELLTDMIKHLLPNPAAKATQELIELPLVKRSKVEALEFEVEALKREKASIENKRDDLAEKLDIERGEWIKIKKELDEIVQFLKTHDNIRVETHAETNYATERSVIGMSMGAGFYRYRPYKKVTTTTTLHSGDVVKELPKESSFEYLADWMNENDVNNFWYRYKGIR